jgi:hypothetical protein
LQGFVHGDIPPFFLDYTKRGMFCQANLCVSQGRIFVRGV